MFAGTYDMLPYGGPFWPVTDTVKNVVFGAGKSGRQQDFTVTPYLQLIDFETSLQGTDLTLKVPFESSKTCRSSKYGRH